MTRDYGAKVEEAVDRVLGYRSPPRHKQGSHGSQQGTADSGQVSELQRMIEEDTLERVFDKHAGMHGSEDDEVGIDDLAQERLARRLREQAGIPGPRD